MRHLVWPKLATSRLPLAGDHGFERWKGCLIQEGDGRKENRHAHHVDHLRMVAASSGTQPSLGVSVKAPAFARALQTLQLERLRPQSVKEARILQPTRL